MQINAGLNLLTTAEAADYLRIKERKLYELVAADAIPCTKVSGKWLFPRADLDRWLLAGMARPLGVAPADPPPIIGGSHDPLLQWALAESRAGLAMLPEGSDAGYRRFLKGEVVATAIHFHDVEELQADANVRIVSSEAMLYDSVLIGFATRVQGFLVASGNPLKISTIADASARKARLVTRPQGAGAQQLLEALMRKENITEDDLPAAILAPTGPDVAQAIATSALRRRRWLLPQGSTSCRWFRSGLICLCASATLFVRNCNKCSSSCARRTLQRVQKSSAGLTFQPQATCAGRRSM